MTTERDPSGIDVPVTAGDRGWPVVDWPSEPPEERSAVRTLVLCPAGFDVPMDTDCAHGCTDEVCSSCPGRPGL